MKLDINKNSYKLEKEFGKMIPVIFKISDKTQLSDLLKMVEFKKN